ncbi:GTPase [Geosmithia morbida]|uniref:GTPase n=1 Tax=Geosmithia morbida TaxID=1094350 RepID=A0A9P4Z345_9HYPO|nr:GTPase [Geosmithia morbida]KAF4126641.1 GTPase [Geosmithia morbida]
MTNRRSRVAFTLAPFLYPHLTSPSVLRSSQRTSAAVTTGFTTTSLTRSQVRRSSSSSPNLSNTSASAVNGIPESHLNPAPDDYAAPKFADKAQIALYAGRGGNGCVSFLRDMFLPEGPPNGGDGGNGGNIYIQAAPGETSLYKLARRRFARAPAGKHGQGSARSGTRGEDVIITVPVGTVVRELERYDPVAEEETNLKIWQDIEKQRRKEERIAEEERRRRLKGNPEEKEEYEEAIRYSGNSERSRDIEEEEEDCSEEGVQDPRRDKWLLYPGMTKGDMKAAEFPKLPRRARPLYQPPGPIVLDLSRPTEQPILLAAGGVGGLGNPHFTSRAHPRPVFATKGSGGVTMKIELELKLIADVGLVGLPNAGKSTLLRALTNSRTRVGNWAFTTLQPNIGTVILDKYSGRPTVAARPANSDSTDNTGPRTRFTVADIPGLIEGAHLDRGLGIAFLRHVERAGVLAFVIDLAAGDAVAALDALWREVGLYARMRQADEQEREAAERIDWSLTSDSEDSGRTLTAQDMLGARRQHDGDDNHSVLAPGAERIASKPWFVVATKADLPETQANFGKLRAYLDAISKGEAPHPSGVDGAWTKNCTAIPVSAINGQGVDRIVHWTAGLLDL